jgi:hypothetical protein
LDPKRLIEDLRKASDPLAAAHDLASGRAENAMELAPKSDFSVAVARRHQSLFDIRRARAGADQTRRNRAIADAVGDIERPPSENFSIAKSRIHAMIMNDQNTTSIARQLQPQG